MLPAQKWVCGQGTEMFSIRDSDLCNHVTHLVVSLMTSKNSLDATSTLLGPVLGVVLVKNFF